MTIRKFAILCGLLLTPVWAISASAQEAKEVPIDGRVALHIYAALVENELGDILDGLETLAETEELRSGDWERAKPLLHRFAQRETHFAAIWYARPDGSYFTVEQGKVGQSIADRPYFSTLMSGHAVSGHLVVSRSTGKRAMVIAAPIIRDGKTIAAAGASIDLEKLGAWLDERLRLPQDMIFYALDMHGQVALHRRARLLMIFPSEMGSETLRAAVRDMLTKPEGTVAYDFEGTRRVVLFERSKTLGLVFVLGIVHPQ